MRSARVPRGRRTVIPGGRTQTAGIQFKAVRDKPPPKPVEYDAFICCAEPADAEMPSTIAANLRRRGFLVFLEDRLAATGPDKDRLALVEAVPDFVLLLTPATVAAASNPDHAVHAEIARALATGRNIVRVSRAEEPVEASGDFSPDLAALASREALTYDPDRLAESLSILRHGLSSDTTVDDRHVMRRTKRWFIFAALFVFVGFSLQTVPALIKAWQRPKPLPPVAPFTLYWSGFGQRMENGIAVGFPLVTDARVSGGERISVAFSPSANGFAYVISKDARGRVSVLFPAETVKGASRVRAGTLYQAPVETAWMTVDPQAGLDTIYVFAGYDPLQNLEELVEEPETPTNIGARRELVAQTVAGLIDGRHYQFGRRVWIRTMQFVDQSLQSGPGPATFASPVAEGGDARHPATVQRGLVSALAEIKFTFVATKYFDSPSRPR